MPPLTFEQAMQHATQLHRGGRVDEAIAMYRQILLAAPTALEAMNLLSQALREKGELPEAIALLERAVSLQPKSAALANNLGIAYRAAGRIDDAVRSYQRAAQLAPGNSAPLNNLGIALKEVGRLDEAIDLFRRAIALNPNAADLHNSLAQAQSGAGLLDESLAGYERAIALKPDFVEAHSNLIYTMHFHERFDARAIFEAHRRWQQAMAEPLKRFIQPFTNDRSPDRRLKVGYVSADLHEHVVARFLLPLLLHHDRAQFELFAYSNDHRPPDAMTRRLQQAVDHWRPIAGQGDEIVAQQIRADAIDILIDLSMHMAHNRMLLFARKPVPVQATYLAYCSTTGLDTIDYRISDPHLDPPQHPPGVDETIYSEKTIRLPQTYWCYQPSIETPPVVPRDDAAPIAFGCLNNFIKVRPAAISGWCAILRAVPNSRMILHADEGSHRNRVADQFKSEGVDPARLEFIGHLPIDQFYALHHRIDIALDPFPYGGGTTSCDALWMGVPLVTLRGRTAVGRGGASILSNLGLEDLIAKDEAEYIRIATSLAQDQPRLTALRADLRNRMLRSPLTDAPAFARGFEAALRQMWRDFCAE